LGTGTGWVAEMLDPHTSIVRTSLGCQLNDEPQLLGVVAEYVER